MPFSMLFRMHLPPDFYVKEAAIKLRASVLQVMTTIELPSLSDVEAVKNGEVKPSDIILSFFRT